LTCCQTSVNARHEAGAMRNDRAKTDVQTAIDQEIRWETLR
jgi:hypothetical protein